MRAAVYARVSTEEQVQNYSIENQLESIRKFCEGRGYKVGGEFVDPGFSGTTLDRPALARLQKAAKAREVDIVVVYKLDRLFRSNRHMYNTLAELEQSGVAVASVTEPFDTSTAMGKAYLGMASTFAEWERNTFVERSSAGMRKAVEKGVFSGGVVAFGYRVNKETRRLEAAEEEASVVRQMFTWLVEDELSCYEIADRLNVMGIPTRYAREGRGLRGKATANIWRPGRVYNMLRNTAYKGQWSYGKRSAKRGTPLTQGVCPALVEEELFNRAQMRLKQNNMWADRNSRRGYLLRGLIKCGACDHNFSGYYSRSTAQGEIRYYRCNHNTARGRFMGARCDTPSLRADMIEEIVWADIAGFIQDPAMVIKALEARLEGGSVDFTQQVADTDKRIEELLEAERRVLRLYADPKSNLSREALDAEVASIADSRRMALRLRRDLEEAQAAEKDKSRRYAGVEEMLATLRERVKTASFEEKRHAVESLLDGITVTKGTDGTPHIRIRYAFEADKAVELRSARMPVRLPR